MRAYRRRVWQMGTPPCRNRGTDIAKTHNVRPSEPRPICLTLRQQPEAKQRGAKGCLPGARKALWLWSIAEKPQCLEESRRGINQAAKGAAYRGVETAKASWPAPRNCWLLMAERPSTGVEAAGQKRHPRLDRGYADALRPERECRRRQAARTGTTPEAGLSLSQPSDVPAVLHFAGGDPQSAEFCDGPGPGMALEQNSRLPPTRPGGAYGKR